MNKHADWLAWSLQFCVGAVVGAVIGFALVSRRRLGGSWLADDLVAIFVDGAALLGGA